MNILSLFDGISCGRLALERANIKVDNYYSSEIDNNAIKVSKDNWNDITHIGDIRNINPNNYKDIDMIIGGSPCQDFSIAGNRLNFDGDKGQLFFEYIKILKIIKPKYFLFENVSMDKKIENAISIKFGNIYPEEAYCKTLFGNFYLKPIKINSKLVSAQLRKRLYWTNISSIKQPKDKKILLQYIIDKGYTDRNKSSALLEGDSRPLKNSLNMFHRYYTTGFTTLIFKNKQHYMNCKKHYINNHIPKRNRNIDNSIYNGVRYFNQNELEKLQTLPVGYTKCLNRNQAASVIGNAWTVDVIVHILKNFFE